MREKFLATTKGLSRRINSVLMVALLTAGCGANGWGNDGSDVKGKVHEDPGGFQVRLPNHWRVTRDRNSGQIEFTSTGGQQMTVWPVFFPDRFEARTASLVLEKFTASRATTTTVWDPPQRVGPTGMRRTGRAGGRSVVSAITWISSPRGTAAWLVLASAPADSYALSEPDYEEILRSLRLTGAASPSDPAVSYVRWEDPNERAFSIEVPENWRTTGGLVRNSPLDFRAAWETVSPDGAIRVTGGDPQMPVFTEPIPMLAMAGFPEGSWYSPGYGVQMLVRRYAPGSVFIREYLSTSLASTCSDLTLLEARDRPDAVDAINRIYAQFSTAGIQVQLSAGEASFTCVDGDAPARGYYFAGTQRIQAAGMPGGIWNVEYLFGFVARESKERLGKSVLAHILETVRVNPYWLAMQQNVAKNTSEIVSRTQAEISHLISDSYWYRQRSLDEIDRRRSNAILGVEDVVDPLTGREIRVESGPNYHWVDPRGTIIGTETDTTPGVDFRGLVRLP